MTAAQASRFHQEKLLSNLIDMANNAINPTQRAMEHLWDVWRQEKHGSVGGESMFTQIEKYAADNPGTIIEILREGDNFIIVLVTEFLLRVHKNMREACEVVFVDTTTHVDQLNTAVTPLLCGGPCGALPLGVIFTSSQAEQSYTKGFQLLKKVLDKSAFYYQNYPNCFITDNSEAERNALRTVWPDSQLFLCVFHVLQQVWRWLCNGSHNIKKEQRPQLMQVARALLYADSAEGI
ncbi:uncharacterized protein LOC135217219 [Macrobrachium nipponense]|uniref:uncharacterized protein LOC135217219 n=1 Tax=Macrobrachium nipponense TaxID=159736 RepID=UPI0030C852C2